MHKITELFHEANVVVDDYLDVEVDSPDYFEALVSLLDETSSRTIGKLLNLIIHGGDSETLSHTTRARVH